MSYTLQLQKTDILSVQLNAAATSGTLTTGSFGSPTGTQLLIVDYDVPAKREVISCTISGTALTSLVRGIDGTSDQTHTANANIMMAFVPEHYRRAAVRTLGYAEVQSNQGSITTVADLTSLSVVVTVPTDGTRIKITGQIRVQTTVNADTVILSIKEGATTLNVGSTALPSSGFATTVIAFHTPTLTATAGSHTYKLTLERSGGSGTLTMVASSTGPAFILVENIE